MTPRTPPPAALSSVVRPHKVPAYYEPVGRPLTVRSPEQELFNRTVTAAEAAHMRGKGVSVSSIADEDPYIPKKSVRQILQTPRFRSILSARGIDLDSIDVLSDRQVALLALLRDHSLPLSERQKCRMLSIPYEHLQNWKNQELFRERYREIYSASLVEATEMADQKLAELIEQNNLEAIKYANAMTGKYRPGDGASQTVQQMLAMVVSVVQRYVTDEHTLVAIGHEFDRLARGEMVTAITAHAGQDEDVIDVEPEPEEPQPDGYDEHPDPQPDRGDPR